MIVERIEQARSCTVGAFAKSTSHINVRKLEQKQNYANDQTVEIEFSEMLIPNHK